MIDYLAEVIRVKGFFKKLRAALSEREGEHDRAYYYFAVQNILRK